MAVVGVYCHRLHLLERLKKYGIIASMVCGVLFIATFVVLKIPAPDGYGYSGIGTLVRALLAVIMFYAFPFEKLPAKIKAMIHGVGSYTMAIYFMHRLVGTILYQTPLNDWLPLHPGSLLDCAIIFLVSLLIAWLLGKIPVKWVKASVM